MTSRSSPCQQGEAPSGCAICPRLAAFRNENRQRFPDFFNAPVPSFGDCRARLLIVGLAPGLKGANRTGRPFTGDAAGVILYRMLERFGFSRGDYQARTDDGLELRGAMITNAVRCVPPRNRPNASEINNCRAFLGARIASLDDLRLILALGRIAHDSIIRSQGLRLAGFPFAHGKRHHLGENLILIDSYHCSRYNLNTGRLSEEMFGSVFAELRRLLDNDPAGQ